MVRQRGAAGRYGAGIVTAAASSDLNTKGKVRPPRSRIPTTTRRRVDEEAAFKKTNVRAVSLRDIAATVLSYYWSGFCGQGSVHIASNRRNRGEVCLFRPFAALTDF
jgi:hypothetical protein